jgi:hypothetical protein
MLSVNIQGNNIFFEIMSLQSSQVKAFYGDVDWLGKYIYKNILYV